MWWTESLSWVRWTLFDPMRLLGTTANQQIIFVQASSKFSYRLSIQKRLTYTWKLGFIPAALIQDVFHRASQCAALKCHNLSINRSHITMFEFIHHPLHLPLNARDSICSPFGLRPVSSSRRTTIFIYQQPQQNRKKPAHRGGCKCQILVFCLGLSSPA